MADAVTLQPTPHLGTTSSPGVSSTFAALFILALIATVALAIFKAKFAGDLAERRGHDRNEAVTTTLLTGDLGLAASYLRGDVSEDPSSRPDHDSRHPNSPDPTDFDAPLTRAEAAAATSDDRGPSELPIRSSSTVEARLRELQRLEREGLISAQEASDRRGEILDEI